MWKRKKAQQPAEGKGVSRRGVLAGAAGAVAGAVVGEAAGGGSAYASNGNPLELGESNTASKTTSLRSTSGQPALEVYTTSRDGYGAATLGTPWVGVIGAAQSLPVTSFFEGQGAGVVGYGFTTTGGLGVINPYSPGGLSVSEAGVFGFAGYGSFSSSPNPTLGVAGFGAGGGTVGVGAYNYAGSLALDVAGNSTFSTAGRSKVGKGFATAIVDDPDVSSQSIVLVTLLGDPGTSAVRWVQRLPGKGFKVWMTQAVTAAVEFGYFRID